MHRLIMNTNCSYLPNECKLIGRQIAFNMRQSKS